MTAQVTRSLTEVFILMRNNAVQSRHIFADQGTASNSKFANVPLDDKEALLAADQDSHLGRIPPEWVSMVDEVQFEMSRIKSKLKDLNAVQQKHVLRPNFDDDFNCDEEKQIKTSTEQITSMLSHCQRLIQHVQKSSKQSLSSSSSPGHSPRRHPSKLLDNVVKALLAALQQLTAEFRQNQSTYLRKLQAREDSYTQYFKGTIEHGGGEDMGGGAPSMSTNHDAMTTYRDDSNLFNATGDDFSHSMTSNVPAAEETLSMAQLQMLEEGNAVVEQREREIVQITRSIFELNHLFKDVASLVVDQGTVVDRIDYNIEQSSMRVKSGLAQVKKAETYQKKNRKMLIIVILAAVVAFLLIVFIIRHA